MRGILERQMRTCRGQTGASRVAGTFNACYVGIGQMRECASAVFGVTLCRPSPSVLDLTCSVYYIPPRRACFDGPPSLFSTCEEEEDTCTRALTLSSFPTITV